MHRSNPDEITDADLWDAFHAAALPPGTWTHKAHVRMGFLYTRRDPFPESLDRLRAGIQRLNAAHGTPEALDRGYHETITCAFLRLISAATSDAEGVDSIAFCEQHPGLLDKRLLLQYYSRERLMTLEAKAEFDEPDLRTLPQPM